MRLPAGFRASSRAHLLGNADVGARVSHRESGAAHPDAAVLG
jgi:hypothetical protein